MDEPDLPLQSRSVIIAIDVGSSSLRCTAYDCSCGSNTNTTTSSLSSSQQRQPSEFTIVASYSYPRKSIETYTGHVLITTNCGGSDSPSTSDRTTGKVNEETKTNDLFDCIDACVDQVLHQLQQQPNHYRTNIVGIGFTTFVMNLIGVDDEYRPIGNTATFSYACQTKQVQEEVQQLQSDLKHQDKQNLYEVTGVPLHTAYALAQLRVWYRTNNIDGMRVTVHQWSTIASICLHRWCHNGSKPSTTSIPISFSEASWTGLLNYHSGRYETQIINLLPPDCIAALPRVADCDNNASTAISPSLTMNDEYAGRWPLLQRTKNFLGVGDGACANIGSKCTSLNRIACTIGTSAAARVCMYYPIRLPADEQEEHSPIDEVTNGSDNMQLRIPSGLFCYRIDRYYVLVGGALTDGGNVMEWISNHLLVPRNDTAASITATVTSSNSELELTICDAEHLLSHDYNEYLQLSKEITSKVPLLATPSLMVIPFFSGERNTGYRSSATGAMIGLTLQTKSHHIVKACLEGITLRLYAIVQLICATVASLQQQHRTDQSRNNKDSTSNNSDELSMMILCSGKALEKNRLWRTMIADCTGLPVLMEEQTYEGTSRGAAILMNHALFQPPNRENHRPGGFVEEDLRWDTDSPLTSNHTTTINNNIMVHWPNRAVQEYWVALSEKQEAMIDALSRTRHWS